MILMLIARWMECMDCTTSLSGKIWASVNTSLLLVQQPRLHRPSANHRHHLRLPSSSIPPSTKCCSTWFPAVYNVPVFHELCFTCFHLSTYAWSWICHLGSFISARNPARNTSTSATDHPALVKDAIVMPCNPILSCSA